MRSHCINNLGISFVYFGYDSQADASIGSPPKAWHLEAHVAMSSIDGERGSGSDRCSVPDAVLDWEEEEGSMNEICSVTEREREREVGNMVYDIWSLLNRFFNQILDFNFHSSQSSTFFIVYTTTFFFSKNHGLTK